METNLSLFLLRIHIRVLCKYIPEQNALTIKAFLFTTRRYPLLLITATTVHYYSPLLTSAHFCSVLSQLLTTAHCYSLVLATRLLLTSKREGLGVSTRVERELGQSESEHSNLQRGIRVQAHRGVQIRKYP